MKILILADEECKSLWDYFDRSKLAGVDLVLSCGDLSPQYLSFIATFTSAPVYMYTATTMAAMRKRLRKVVSA